MDQLELRIAVAHWGGARYLEAFHKGFDPHQITMALCFGGEKAIMAFAGAPSAFGKKDFVEGSVFDQMRRLAKSIQYASSYGATDETVYRLTTAAEDKKTGRMLQANLPFAKVQAFHEAWLRGVPEFERGWEHTEARIRKVGYLVERVTGRRRDFKGRKLNRSEAVNFEIQAGAAGIMNLALQRLLPLIPFGAFGPSTGVINQCHDSLTIEVPPDRAERVRGIMRECMSAKVEAYPDMDFSTDDKVSQRWGKAQELAA